MGLFRSKRKTFVSTSVNRLIPDKKLPDTIKSAMAGALFTGDDLIDSVLEASMSALPSKLERMYRYSAKDTVNGLPSGEVYSNTQGFAEVQQVLDALEGQPVFIQYMRFGGPNTIHMAWMDLVEFYGYNPDTNVLGTLSQSKGTPVYLDDMVVEIPDSLRYQYDEQELTVWGSLPSSGYTPEQVIPASIYTGDVISFVSPTISTVATSLRVRVDYVWKTPAGLQRETMFLAPREPDNDLDFFQAKYKVGDQTKYWAYRYGSGQNPILDAVYTEAKSVMGDFYPNIYFRLGKTNLASNVNSSQYKTNNKLCKYLGIDFEGVSEAIHENPDIRDVEQGFLTLGIPADTSNALELEYLYGFFNAWYLAVGAIADDPKKYLSKYGLMSRVRWDFESHSINIRDRVFEMNLTNDGIYKARFAGNIGPVGTVTLSKTPIASDFGTGLNCRYYRKQVTPEFFEEIRVINLTMKYLITNRHHTTLGDDDGEILLVPLDRTIIRGFTVREEEQLISRSLHFVFNSLVRKKVRWYEQEWFGTFLVVLAVIITVVTLGADGGATLQATLAALAAMSASQLIIWLAWKIAIYFAIREGIKIFVKLVGVEVAMIAAIIAAAYGIQTGVTAGFQATTQIGLTAASLLQVSSALSQGINMELRSMTTDLLADANRFKTFQKDSIKLLEEKMDLLDADSILSPFVILGESPSQLYNRTIHSGNIGTLAFDDIHSYVDRSLRLPDFSSSVGGVFYG